MDETDEPDEPDDFKPTPGPSDIPDESTDEPPAFPVGVLSDWLMVGLLVVMLIHAVLHCWVEYQEYIGGVEVGR